MKTPIALAAAITLGACAAAPAMTYQPEATSFVGWVLFANDEFQLYADQDQVLQPFSRPCVSGVLPRDEQRQAMQDLGGQKVRITGRTTGWSGAATANRIPHEGSVIRNDCGGAFVILADTMRPEN